MSILIVTIRIVIRRNVIWEYKTRNKSNEIISTINCYLFTSSFRKSPVNKFFLLKVKYLLFEEIC